MNQLNQWLVVLSTPCVNILNLPVVAQDQQERQVQILATQTPT